MAKMQEKTARMTLSPLELMRQAAGTPEELRQKLGRLVAMLSTYARGELVERKLETLRRRGHIDQIPSRVQLAVGAVDMLRFWISPAAADYYEQRGINYAFHQVLRFLDEPASLADPVGFFSTRDGIIGHLLQVVHANPVYDLQLLDAFDDGLDQLVAQTEAMIAGTHPRSASIGAVVEEPDYHPRLLAFVRAWRLDPTTPPMLRSNVAQDPRFAMLERTFGTLTGAMRYFCRLPSSPAEGALHLLRVRRFPEHLGEPPPALPCYKAPVTTAPDPGVLGEPTPRRGHVSVVRLPDQWFILATSAQLQKSPLSVKLQGTPLVLFRDGQGRAAALLDRCPHRNVPLSLGRVHLGQLECPYHGWRFDGEGRCRFVPSLCGEHEGKARRAPSLATVEQDGFVWVYSTPDATPTSRPYRFRMLGQPGYTHVRQVVAAEASLHATAENALDVPHTAFLHRGLFRPESRGITITAVVRRQGDRVEAEYVGEPRPPGLVGRMLSPSGGIVTHFDRFLLPSIAEVEYRIGAENHILVASALTPVDDFFTRIFTIVSFRTRLPGGLLAPLLTPIATHIFRQDARILRQQTATIRSFGGEQFVSTEIDVLGKHILRLLRAAERGEIPREEATEEARIPLIV